MPKKESKFLKKCKEHKEDLKILLDNDILEVEGGVVHIHFDADNNIRHIDVEETAYNQ